MIAQMKIKVEATGLEKVKQVFQVLKDVIDNERVPSEVRNEIQNKVNSILDSVVDNQCIGESLHYD